MLLTLCAFFTLLFAIPAASMSSAATSTGYVRVGNLSETTGPVDVYLSPGGPGLQPIDSDVAYGALSGYSQVPVGSYTVKMLPAGAASSAQPLLSASLTVQAGHSYTVAAFSVAGQGRQAKVLDDSLTAPGGKSLVRVIQASINQKDLTFHCSCAKGAAGDLMTDGTTGAVSPYIPIPANTWTMTATGPSAKSSLPVSLDAGTVHTEVVIDTPSGIQIENFLDAAMSQPTVNPIETGFGGTAGHGPGSFLPWLAVIAAGVMLALAGGLRLRRTGVARKEVPSVPTRM